MFRELIRRSAALAVGMGFLIVERLWYVNLVFPADIDGRLRQWHQRRETSSWEARKIRQATISQARLQLEKLLPLLKKPPTRGMEPSSGFNPQTGTM